MALLVWAPLALVSLVGHLEWQELAVAPAGEKTEAVETKEEALVWAWASVAIL